MIKAGY